MTLDLSHLAATVKEEAFNDAPTRIRFAQTERWVEYSRGRLALEELERRFQYPTCARMPCMLLYGDSGMGKTMLIEKMQRQHPDSLHERRGVRMRPVLRVQMTASPDERRFYTRLLELLGAPYTSHDQIGALEGRVLHILHEICTKLLCIDEVNHLLAGTHREQRRALNLLKFMANELRIAVIAVGTIDAFHAIQIDSQVASRFAPLFLPHWTEVDGFRGFVTGFGRLLPLRKASPFGDAQMIRTLLDLSGGITGNVTELLARAAEAAILDGSESIDPAMLVKHHDRLRAAAS